MIIRLRYFHDNGNDVILVPACEIFSAKCAQFSLTFTE